MPENNLIQDLLAVIKGSFPASFKNPPLSEEQLSLIGEKFKPIISQHQSEGELITDSRDVTILWRKQMILPEHYPVLSKCRLPWTRSTSSMIN